MTNDVRAAVGWRRRQQNNKSGCRRFGVPESLRRDDPQNTALF